jgi:hypothetical protein
MGAGQGPKLQAAVSSPASASFPAPVPVPVGGKPVLFPALAASFCTAAVLYPLELLNSLKMAGVGSSEGGGALSTMQLIAYYTETHGVRGIFLQGLVPHVARSTLMNFVAFALFPPLHQLLFRRDADSGNGLSRAVAGSLVTIPEVRQTPCVYISASAAQQILCTTSNMHVVHVVHTLNSCYYSYRCCP